MHAKQQTACTLTENDKITQSGCELGREDPTDWSMHIGVTQMASPLNMDEGSDTSNQADSVEKRERRKEGGRISTFISINTCVFNNLTPSSFLHSFRLSPDFLILALFPSGMTL